MITAYGSAVILMVLNLMGILVKDVRPIFYFNFYAVPHISYILLLVYFGVSTTYALFELANAYTKSTLIRKNQIRYFFISAMIGYIGGSSTFLPKYGISIPPYLVAFYLVHPLTIAYAIIKHQLMDTDLAWRYIVMHGIAWVILFVPFVPFIFLFKSSPLGILAVFAGAMFVASRLYPCITSFLKPYIFKKYSYWDELDKLAQKRETIYKPLDVLRNFIENVHSVMKLEGISIFMFNKEKQCFVPTAQIGEFDLNTIEIAPAHPLVEVVTQKRSVLREMLTSDEADPKHRQALQQLDAVEADTALALMVGGKLNGIIFLGGKNDGTVFHEEELYKLYSLLDAVEWSFEHAMSIENETSRLQDMYQQHLINASQRLIEIHNLDDLALRIALIMQRSGHAMYAVIYLYDPERKKYFRRKERGAVGKNTIEMLDETDYFIQFLFEREGPVLYKQIQQWAEETRTRQMKHLEEVARAMGVKVVLPIILDKVLGFVGLGERRGGGDYMRPDWNTFNLVTYTAAMAIQNIVYSEDVIKDAKTNLYNHRHFFNQATESMIHAMRYTEQVSLMMIDIDHFKKVNDTYGHEKGDEILKLLAQHLKDSVRPSDIACRYGGEEFVVILPETNLEGAKALGERLRTGLKKKDVLKAVTISIGICCFIPSIQEREKYEHDLPMIRQEFINRADKALYRAKETGRDRVCVAEEFRYTGGDDTRLKQQYTVLMITNDTETARIYTQYFEMHGYTMQSIGTEEQGRALCAEQKPRIVMIDGDTIDMNVAAFVKDITTTDTDVSIGVMTTHAERKQEMLDIGIQRFFGKPVPLTEIEEWLSYMTKR